MSLTQKQLYVRVYTPGSFMTEIADLGRKITKAKTPSVLENKLNELTDLMEGIKASTVIDHESKEFVYREALNVYEKAVKKF